jgi:hypothetical protein
MFLSIAIQELIAESIVELGNGFQTKDAFKNGAGMTP